MAAPTLVAPQIDLGRQIAHSLLQDSLLHPSAAMWIYDGDAHEWRFLIASEDVDKRGPQAAYARVRNVLKRAGLNDRIPLRRYVVVSPADPLISRMAAVVDARDLAETTFVDCGSLDATVTAAYVYALETRLVPVSFPSGAETQRVSKSG